MDLSGPYPNYWRRELLPRYWYDETTLQAQTKDNVKNQRSSEFPTHLEKKTLFSSISDKISSVTSEQDLETLTRTHCISFIAYYITCCTCLICYRVKNTQLWSHTLVHFPHIILLYLHKVLKESQQLFLLIVCVPISPAWSRIPGKQSSYRHCFREVCFGEGYTYIGRTSHWKKNTT